MNFFPLALAEAIAAKLETRASGRRAFWFQAKSLGNTGFEPQIERERTSYEQAESLATEAAEIAHRLSRHDPDGAKRIAEIFACNQPRSAA